jgi:hypothetical protein
MRRTLNADSFNLIAADPEVRPFLGGDPREPLDLSGIVGKVDNFAFLTPNADGGYILDKRAPGLYCAHTLALPSARGRPMLTLMREGFKFMFNATDANEICTIVPDGADAADRWAKTAGFQPFCRRETWFPLLGEIVGAEIRILTYADWVMRETHNKAQGERFHATLEALGRASHPDDPAHDHWVGATLAGCIAGNPSKAIGLYNRYASMAGYQTASFLSATPLTVHTGDAIVTLSPSGEIEILGHIG